MPPLRKSKRKSMSELLHMRDSPQCQSFSVDVPLPMDGSSSLDGSHIFTSTTKRGNQMTSKSGMLPPRKSKKYRGDESAKEVQATLQLTTQESSLPLADAGAKKQHVIELLKSHGGLSYVPVSLGIRFSLRNRFLGNFSLSSSLSTLQKSIPVGHDAFEVGATRPDVAMHDDSEGNRVSHLHAAKKTLQASSLKVSHLHAALSSKPLTEMKSLRPLEKSTATPCKSAKIDHTARAEKTGPSNPSMKRKMNEICRH